MNSRKLQVISAMALSIALAGCISTPQTKALITPVGVIGVHSFAPPAPQPRTIDFMEQRRLAQQAEQERAASGKHEG